MVLYGVAPRWQEQVQERQVYGVAKFKRVAYMARRVGGRW